VSVIATSNIPHATSHTQRGASRKLLGVGWGRWDAGCFPPSRRAWLCCGLAVLLAGCASAPRERAPDWEQEAGAASPAVPLAPLALSPPAATPATAMPAAPAIPPGETWVPLSQWCQAKGLTAPYPVTVGSSAAFAVATPGGVLVLRPGSQSALWDGLDIRLGFAPEIIGGQPCVHTLDVQKTLDPLVSPCFLNNLGANPTVVIDPGHGGADCGTRSVLGEHCEKEYTLDWGRRLAFLLAGAGWRVSLTRTGDTEVAISNRIAFAEACHADLFLSLHFNSSAPNDRQAGLETYCLTPTGMTSSVRRGYNDDPALVFPNNAFDAENLQLAWRVHRALLQVNGGMDRGVRRARYLGVLRGQNRPAILVEGGYLSNPTEARRIADPAYRQKLAEAVARGVE
jgi:N-acetylmuramoyl-L-alanine amidase